MKWKNSALHSGRQSDPYHLDQFILMNMELIQIELKASCLMNQAAQHQQCGNALGYNGGCCNARNTHMEADDKNQVENHIDDAGGKQKIQGLWVSPVARSMAAPKL